MRYRFTGAVVAMTLAAAVSLTVAPTAQQGRGNLPPQPGPPAGQGRGRRKAKPFSELERGHAAAEPRVRRRSLVTRISTVSGRRSERLIGTSRITPLPRRRSGSWARSTR